MVPNEPPSVSVSRRGHNGLGSDPLRTVVWLSGEHDIASRGHLSVTIAQAASLDDSDIVVDLGGITFMDAATIGALVVARNRLRSRSHTLSVRAPSPPARRLLEVCGLAQLIDEPLVTGLAPMANVLGSCVALAAADDGSDRAKSPVYQKDPFREFAHATERRPVEPAGLQQRPALS